MDGIRSALYRALQDAGQSHVLEEDVELMHNAVWLVAREDAAPMSAASTPPFWWTASSSPSDASSDATRARRQCASAAAAAAVLSPSTASLPRALLDCWMRLNFSMSAHAGARERADELLESCARLIGWRLGVHDAGLVSFEAVPDGAPEVARWWSSVGPDWQLQFGRVERKPTFSAANLIALFNNAALERYGVMVWRLPRAQGYALKNVYFLSSWDVRADQRALDYVQSCADRVMSGQDAWPPHDWFLSVDEESGLRLARACVARLRSMCESDAENEATERARRFLSPRGGVDVCDASFRLLDFFAQGMHEELDRAFSASAPSAGAVCLLFALYRYCMETICIPLFSDMKRAKRKLAEVAPASSSDATPSTSALLSRQLRCREACESTMPRAVSSTTPPSSTSSPTPPKSSPALAPTPPKSSPAPAPTPPKSSPAPAPVVSVVAPAPAPVVSVVAPAPSRGRQAVQCWYRGRRYDSITEAKVSVFLHELSRAYGGASLSLDIKPGVVEVAGLLQLLRARVGNESYVPDALESSRWYPDFALCLSGFNYWVEVKYHATRLLIGEQEKYHVVGAADRPVLLISVDNGCIQPPYSTGRREYTSSTASASPSASFGTSSAGVTMTCFRGGRRYDVVFAERADGAIDLFPCPEDLRAVRALAWNAPKLLAAYSAAHGVERVYCARPDAESTSNPTSLCIQQQA